MASHVQERKLTTTQLKSNHLVERLLVSVVPFVTHCQAVLTFTKPCESRVLVILQHRFRKLVLGNCHNKSFLKQRLMVILHTVTKLVWQQLMFVNTSTQVFVAKRMELGAVVGAAPRKMLSVKT